MPTSDARRRFGGRAIQDAVAAALLTLSVAPWFAGCGGPDDPFERVAVEGTVTVDGEPLDRGTIRFIPTDTAEGPKTALPIRTGAFAGDTEHGPVAGPHRVEIVADRSDRLPHDGEAVLEELRENRQRVPPPPRLLPADRPGNRLIHHFVPDQLNRCEFHLVSRPR